MFHVNHANMQNNVREHMTRIDKISPLLIVLFDVKKLIKLTFVGRTIMNTQRHQSFSIYIFLTTWVKKRNL